MQSRSQYILLTALSIFLARRSLTIYYDWRISKTQAYLEHLNKERDAAIERLKAATKYNTTQQLLEKYGSSPKPKGSPSSPSQPKAKGAQNPNQPTGPRTGIPPPPTANIQRPATQHPSTPQKQVSAPSSPQGPPPPLPQIPNTLPPDAPGAEFAPNAYEGATLTKQYSASAATTFTQHHWYDRILDALLGEDETQPKNRLALICTECRLVNGQAPPGTKSLEEVGRWRCSSCHAWNGQERTQDAVVANLVQGLQAEQEAKEIGIESGADSDVKDTDNDEVPDMREGTNVDSPNLTSSDSLRPAKSTRSKSKGKGKK